MAESIKVSSASARCSCLSLLCLFLQSVFSHWRSIIRMHQAQQEVVLRVLRYMWFLTSRGLQCKSLSQYLLMHSVICSTQSVWLWESWLHMVRMSRRNQSSWAQSTRSRFLIHLLHSLQVLWSFRQYSYSPDWMVCQQARDWCLSHCRKYSTVWEW